MAQCKGKVPTFLKKVGQKTLILGSMLLNSGPPPGIEVPAQNLKFFEPLSFKKGAVYRAVLSAETWLEDCHVAKLGLAVASPQLARLARTMLWGCASLFRAAAW
ncbi:MAG: hypothetical protein IJP07_05850, partial [Firmicutes bacterium]|nr:hypothetical protein [Bacillota bacterium]